MAKYDLIEHPSELKIRSMGYNLSDLFVTSALGMMDYIYQTLPTETDETIRVEVTSENMKSLLVDWLSKLLCLSDTNKRAYTKFKILKLSSCNIIAEVGSVKAEALNDIKAVTYHELKITKTNFIWESTVVYDI
jgi:SHS2 domain-containing protein